MNELLKKFKEISDLKSTGEEFEQTNPKFSGKRVIYILGAIFGFLASTMCMIYVEGSYLFLFIGIFGMMIMMYSIQKLVQGLMN
ncbi:hypothetical protein [Marinilactibacillus sp. Marseille-P9653]|uniref:hypothetical protein n=1 Tax=Marinilactibacillus sp. Marseille-P9653 TaxID=2866583 RepID=UPI001CE4244A|nr:hypothetical protein [Marinilactibacillus sp. Marseille-P9653]